MTVAADFPDSNSVAPGRRFYQVVDRRRALANRCELLQRLQEEIARAKDPLVGEKV
jgi:hypothetical protein